MLNNPKELLEFLNDSLKPKQIEKRKYGEVFTPMSFINDFMLKDIEDYWMNKYQENIWENENLTWYDPAAGMGNYAIAIFYKLMNGLKVKISNEEDRRKHILKHQLFMGELNKKNCYMQRQIFSSYKLNLYEGDTLQIDIDSVFNVNKFDFIIGNPPYNEELKTTGAKPLYNKFIEYYIDKCQYLSFITPSRWFAGGKGLDKFRKMMINRTDVIYIKHFDDATSIFGNSVDIKGGVSYFLIDSEYSGLCTYNNSQLKLNKYDIIVDSKFYNLIDKLNQYNKIIKYYISQDHYKIQTNDKRLNNKNSKELIKCYVSQQKGLIKYIEKSEIDKSIDNYKVITARAAFTANSSFGNMFIGYPNDVHSKSYISFNVNSEDEANSLLSYLKCKLPNVMLSLRKITQDISENTLRWIPLPPLDRIWNNEATYNYFDLSKDDIELINKTKLIGFEY
jgi:hypothetical protein